MGMNIKQLIDGVDEVALKVYQGKRIVFLATEDHALALAAAKRLGELGIRHIKWFEGLFPERALPIYEQRRLVSRLIADGFTQPQVIFTASPIVLSDAFPSQIGKPLGYGLADIQPVTFPTFGAEPSRILLHLFNREDTIGLLSEQKLKEWTGEDWTGRRDELEQIVQQIGGGWPRAKLTESLNGLPA